jgi:hypothetical protein
VCDRAQRNGEEAPRLSAVPAQKNRCSGSAMPQSKHQETIMTATEARALMDHHGIAVMQQAVYHYKGFRYGHLMDALNYAELVTSRESAARDLRERTNR